VPDSRTAILLVTALATLVLPAAFLVVLLGALLRRRSGVEPGPGWEALIAFLGGASLGTLFVVANDVILGAPIGLITVLVALGQWRAGRRPLAAQLVLGAALPWTLLWAAYMVLSSRGEIQVAPAEAVIAFLAGAVPCALAILVLLQKPARSATVDATGAGPDAGTRAGPPTGRSFRAVGAAIREPSRLGPFGLPEVAALVALVASELAITFLVALGLPAVVGYLLAVLGSSALATEAYLRAMAPRTRRSMEAFMWLGSSDLAAVRVATGRGVPTTRAGAADWLARHPATPREAPTIASLRVELSLLAGRAAEARTLVEQLPDATPIERFNKAASADVVAWWTGEGDATPELAEALAEIEPANGDDRLRSEVALAVARVRHLLVASPPAAEPLGPLLDVRDRLATRADGIVRRILWPRLYRVFVLTAILFAVAGAATGLSAPLF
jgi:hypothetical protein